MATSTKVPSDDGHSSSDDSLSSVSSDGEVMLFEKYVMSSSSDEAGSEPDFNIPVFEITEEVSRDIENLLSTEETSKSGIHIYPKAMAHRLSDKHPSIGKYLDHLSTKTYSFGIATKIRLENLASDQRTSSKVIADVCVFSTTHPLLTLTFVHKGTLRNKHKHHNSQVTRQIEEAVLSRTRDSFSSVHGVLEDGLSLQEFSQKIDQLTKDARITFFPHALMMTKERCLSVANTVITLWNEQSQGDMAAKTTESTESLECPICYQRYNKDGRVRQHMPCCINPVCQHCQLKSVGTDGLLHCPFCRTKTRFHFIEAQKDQLKDKIRNGEAEECPDHCQQLHFYCVTCFKPICRDCTVLDHVQGEGHKVVPKWRAPNEIIREIQSRVGEQEGNFQTAIDDLEGKRRNVENSVERAKAETNKTFDGLITKLLQRKGSGSGRADADKKFDDVVAALQQRRNALLAAITQRSGELFSDIDNALELNRVAMGRLESSKDIIDKLEDITDITAEALQLITSSSESLRTMMETTVHNVDYSRAGVVFVPANVQHVSLCAQVTGLVRTVKFSSTKDERRPGGHDVVMSPSTFPTEPIQDVVIPGANGCFTCPRLEWDPSTARRDVTISGSTVTNTKPDPLPENTRCHFQESRHIPAMRPLVVRENQRVIFCVRVSFLLKKVFDANTLIFELAMTPTPCDAVWNQTTGVSVMVCTNKDDPQFYLQTRHNNTPRRQTPVCANQPGVSGKLNLCFLLDGGARKVHVVDVDGGEMVHIVSGVQFDDPLWVLMKVPPMSNVDFKAEVISGDDVNLSEESVKRLDKLT